MVIKCAIKLSFKLSLERTIIKPHFAFTFKIKRFFCAVRATAISLQRVRSSALYLRPHLMIWTLNEASRHSEVVCDVTLVRSLVVVLDTSAVRVNYFGFVHI